jgi:hypothetical protein
MSGKSTNMAAGMGTLTFQNIIKIIPIWQIYASHFPKKKKSKKKKNEILTV